MNIAASIEPRQGWLGRVRSLAQGTGGKAILTIADQGVVSAANFATSIIVGRACSQDEFGLYLLGFSLLILSVNTQASLVTSAYTVFSPRYEGHAHKIYTGSTLAHQVLLSIVMVAGLAIGSGILSVGMGREGLGKVLAVLASVIVFLLMKEYARQVSFAGLRTRAALLIDTSVSILQVGGLIALAWWGALSASRAYAAIGAGAGIVAVAWLLTRRRDFAFQTKSIRGDFLQNWSFSRWIFAYNLAFIASNQIYPWLLFAKHGADANAVFGSCTNVIFLANPFLIGMGNFLGPKTAHAFADGGVSALRGVVRKSTLFLAAVIGLFCVIIFYAGAWLVVLFYGEKYSGQGAVVSILAASQLIWAFTIPLNFGLNAMERPDVAFKSLLLALAITATAGVWMVWQYGPAGVAMGLLSGNAAAWAYTWWTYRRQVRALMAAKAAAGEG